MVLVKLNTSFVEYSQGPDTEEFIKFLDTARKIVDNRDAIAVS